jgi:hypothetical protein
MNDITVYRKDGMIFVRYSGLYEGMTIKDFARMIGKSNDTIIRHYKKLFPLNIIKSGVKIKLSLEEQERVLKSFPNFELVKQATRIPVDQKERMDAYQLRNNESSIDRSQLSIEGSQLPPAERIQIFKMFLEHLKREADKDRQESEARYNQLIDMFLKLAGLPTDNETKLGYILKELAYETIEKSDDDYLKKLSLIYKENSNENNG